MKFTEGTALQVSPLLMTGLVIVDVIGRHLRNTWVKNICNYIAQILRGVKDRLNFLVKNC